MENPQEPESPKPLRSPSQSTSEATFDVPNILLDAVAQGGIITHSVREGRARQVEMTTAISYSEEPVESEETFVIRARNQINFGGARISVINDETELDDKHFPATAPTASEYLALVGKPVLIQFSCRVDEIESKRLKRTVFKTVRNTIILP